MYLDEIIVETNIIERILNVLIYIQRIIFIHISVIKNRIEMVFPVCCWFLWIYNVCNHHYPCHFQHYTKAASLLKRNGAKRDKASFAHKDKATQEKIPRGFWLSSMWVYFVYFAFSLWLLRAQCVDLESKWLCDAPLLRECAALYVHFRNDKIIDHQLIINHLKNSSLKVIFISSIL